MGIIYFKQKNMEVKEMCVYVIISIVCGGYRVVAVPTYHTLDLPEPPRQQEHVLVITSKHSLTGHLGRGIGKYKQFTNIKRSYELSFSSIISISDS